MQNLKLSTEWDKTFPKSEKVNHRKITFHNRYGITLAADMYIPVKSVDSLRRLPFADRSERLRSRHRACMRRPWRNAAFSQSHLTRHLREKAAVS